MIRNVIGTVCFVALTCSVAVFYPNVSSVLSIMGGGCSVTICYTIPIIAYLKLSKEPWYACKNLTPLVFFCCLIFLGYSSCISTIYMIATGK